MPELPEVETIVRGLRDLLLGRRIVEIRLGKTDFMDDPRALAESLPGTRIAGVTRLGKFICLELIPGGPDADSEKRLYLHVHLGMTGQLTLREPGCPASPHTHVFLALDDGRELRYTDIRRFGRMALVGESRVAGFRSRLGCEPLEIPFEQFRARLGGRRARIKALLLDQRVFRGLGNICADEILFRAEIHPARLASKLSRSQMARLHRAVREVLSEAIHLRGSSISDYVDAEGNPGEFQRRHQVYQREGKACARCGKNIRRVIVAGRSSYFCPRCQRAPRPGIRPGQSQRTVLVPRTAKG